jgi:hypothetical protein
MSQKGNLLIGSNLHQKIDIRSRLFKSLTETDASKSWTKLIIQFNSHRGGKIKIHQKTNINIF